ncbi:MAG: hypothetical protein ACOZCP_03620 [Pseudomonadota bacterium]
MSMQLEVRGNGVVDFIAQVEAAVRAKCAPYGPVKRMKLAIDARQSALKGNVIVDFERPEERERFVAESGALPVAEGAAFSVVRKGS